MRRSEEEEEEEEDEEEEEERQDVLPRLANQTASVGQGLVPAPQLCVYQSGVGTGTGTGQDELDPRLTGYQSDRINCSEVTDWVTQDHGYYNRQVSGQWNFQNTVYHGGHHDQEFTEQFRFLMAEQARVGYNNFQVHNSSVVYPAGVGQDRNFGYQDQNVYPIPLQAIGGYSENTGYGRPCYLEQGLGNNSHNYENKAQNNLRWFANPAERREGPPCTCTQNHTSPVDLSLHPESGQVNRYGPYNDTTSANTVDFRLNNYQDWNSFDAPLDMSMYKQTLDVVPDSQIQCANSFGNIHGASGNDSNTLDWRLNSDDWNSLDIPLDMSMTGLAAMGSGNGAPAVPENLMPYAAVDAGSGNLHAGSNGKGRHTDSNFETVDWSSLDFPLDMSANTQATDPVIGGSGGGGGGPRVAPVDNQIQRTSSAESLPAESCSSGQDKRKKRSSEKSEGFERYVRPIYKRRRKGLAPTNVPLPQPKTRNEQLQQLLEDALLASYRPILPKPREVKSPEPTATEKAGDDDGRNEPQEMRKRWRGWKCCEETFDDYNLYQYHVQSAHEKTDTATTTVKKKSIAKKTTIKKKPASSTTSSKSKAVMCPFCLTNHEVLGTDIATKQSWTGSDFLLCPLCQRKYKTLRQLKIHFCLHFQVKVNEVSSESKKPTCRYCKRSFVRFVTLREHETDCAAKQNCAAERNCQVKGQRIGSAAEVVASTATPASSSSSSASAASASAAAAARVSTATTPSASTKKASMIAVPGRTRASAAMATESTAAAAAEMSGADTPPPSVAAAATTSASNSSDERLFYCPDCGKLFTWEGSVRRHQQRSHAKPQDQGRRKKVQSPKQSDTNRTQKQPKQLDHGDQQQQQQHQHHQQHQQQHHHHRHQHHQHHQQQQQSIAASPANPVVTWSNEDLLDELLIDEQIN